MKKFISLFMTIFMLFSSLGFSQVYASDAQQDEILFEEDFDDYELKTYTNAELAAKNTKATIGETWTGAYEVKQTANGTKYLNITFPNKKHTTGGYKFDLPEMFTHGNLVVEMKILVEKFSPTAIFKYLQIDGKLSGTDTSKNYETFATSDGEYRYIKKGVFSSYDTTISTNGLALDNENFWNLRFVYNRKTTDDNWSATVYNTFNGSVIASNVDVDPSIGLDVTGIRFVDMYAMADNTPTQFANITGLKVYKPKKVTFTPNGDYNAAAKIVSFNVSEGLDAATLTKDGAVTVTGPDGDHGATAILDNNILTVALTDKLTESGTYEVNFNGVKTLRNTAVYDTAKFNAVIANSDEILFEEDFDDYEAKTYTKDELAVKNAQATFVPSWTSTYEVKATTSGKKYLKINFPDTVNTGGGYRFNLPEKFTQGNLVVEMKILIEKYSPNVIFKYLQVNGKQSGTNTNKNYETFATSDGEYRYIRKGVLSSYDTTISGNGLALDNENFWNLRFVYNRKTTDDNWSVTIYNTLNGSVIASNVNIAHEEGIDVEAILFADMWAMATKTPTQFANITDLKVYKPKKVIFTPNGEYSVANKTISFNVSESLDASTLAKEGAVTVTGPDGEHEAAATIENDVLTLTFAKKLIESGKYTVDFNGVKTLRNAAVYSTATFNAEIPNVDEILFEEDFDDYDLKTYSNAEMAAKNTKATIMDGWTGGYEVKQTESGKKYVSIYEPTTVGTTNAYRVMLDERFTEGTFVVEMKMLPEKFNAASYGYKLIKMFGKETGSETVKDYTTLKTAEGDKLIVANGVLSSYDTYSQTTLTTDEHGFWHIRLVYSRNSADDNWTMAVYNGVNGNVIAPEVSIDKATGLDITQIDFVDMYAMANSTNTRHINLTDLKVYKPKRVVFTPYGKYDSTNNTIAFNVSEDLDTASLAKAGAVTISSGWSASVATTATYSSGLLTVNVPEGMRALDSYTVSFNGVKTLRKMPVYEAKFGDTTKNYDITDLTFSVDGSDVQIMPETGNSISVSGTMTHSSETAQGGIALLVVYDEDNRLAGIDNQDIAVSKSTPFTLDLAVENLTINSGYKAKLIFIKDLDTISPLRAMEVLANTQF